MKPLTLECVKLNYNWEKPLIDMFCLIKNREDNIYFHPHPFTKEEAEKLARYEGQDLYYILTENYQILGYGMLRGWDEGYRVPSLGIYIHPDARGMGLGKLLMQFLHAIAKRKGAKKIRLKVYSDNVVALKLYESLGYVFEKEEAGQLVGILEFNTQVGK